MKIRQITAPKGLIAALEKRQMNYTEAEELMHLIWLESDTCIGVFGDPDNGSYEWFVWSRATLRHSDCGYSSPEVALREVILAEMANL